MSSINDYLDSYIENLSSLCNECDSDVLSYRALTRIDNVEEPENGEKKRQDNLIASSSKLGFSHALARKYNSNKISFCQFTSEGYNIDDDEDKEKFYINCDRDKIAKISKKLMKQAKREKTNLSFKITYEDGISDNYKRNDNIVIYTESPQQADSIINILKDIQNKHPGYFNSKKSMPFMPRVNGASFLNTSGIQKPGRKTEYLGFSNYSKFIDNTWNNIMSEILQESLVFSVDITNTGTHVPHNLKDPSTQRVPLRLTNSLISYLNMSQEDKKATKELMINSIKDLCEKNKFNIDRRLFHNTKKQENTMVDSLQNKIKPESEHQEIKVDDVPKREYALFKNTPTIE